MESRELWERNAVLAEAFCVSDDQVAAAQTTLDEAQADRTRLLAAFAVTVGSDAAVGRLLGLAEREVRMARRTVGKEDARRVAQHLLSTQPPVETAADDMSVGELDAGERVAAAAPPADMLTGGLAHDGHRELTWTHALDGLLVQGWKGRVDLQVLAEQIGADLGALLIRLQYLAAEGRLEAPSSHGPHPSAGRHRRTGGHYPLGHAETGYGPQYATNMDGVPVADPWPQGLPSFAPDGHWGFIPHQITETSYAGLS